MPQGGLGTTRKTTFTDRPPLGRWVYRVEVISSVPPPATDLILVSKPAFVLVR